MTRHDKKHHKDEPTRAGEPAAAPPPLPEGQAPPEATAAQASPPPDALAAMRAERDDYLARLQRVSADYLNYQKRVQKEMAEVREYAGADLIKNLLGVLDNMERALEAAKANHAQDDPLLAGMLLVHQHAMEVLSGFGLRRIEATGQPFNPDLHQALMQTPSADHPPHTVLKELQAGYQLKGRTIRPSGVVVSVEPESPKAEEQKPPEETQEQAPPTDE